MMMMMRVCDYRLRINAKLLISIECVHTCLGPVNVGLCNNHKAHMLVDYLVISCIQFKSQVEWCSSFVILWLYDWMIN